MVLGEKNPDEQATGTSPTGIDGILAEMTPAEATLFLKKLSEVRADTTSPAARAIAGALRLEATVIDVPVAGTRLGDPGEPSTDTGDEGFKSDITDAGVIDPTIINKATTPRPEVARFLGSLSCSEPKSSPPSGAMEPTYDIIIGNGLASYDPMGGHVTFGVEAQDAPSPYGSEDRISIVPIVKPPKTIGQKRVLRKPLPKITVDIGPNGKAVYKIMDPAGEIITLPLPNKENIGPDTQKPGTTGEV